MPPPQVVVDEAPSVSADSVSGSLADRGDGAVEVETTFDVTVSDTDASVFAECLCFFVIHNMFVYNRV